MNSGPLPRIDRLTIAAAIESSINAYHLSFACLPGAVVHDLHDSTWIDSGIPDSTLNWVLGARFSADTVDEGIKSILSHFRRRSSPLTWQIGPSSEPHDLDRHLVVHGLTHDEDEPGMAVEIEHIKAGLPVPDDLAIEPVRDDSRLREWIDLWLFPVPDEVRQVHFDALRARGLGDDSPWRYYIGRLNGTPVATSELFTDGAVAAVHFVVTLPSWRRQGIGSAMTLHVLREAQTAGYRVGVLTASPSGIGAYRRIGFREYCTFRHYEFGG